MGPEVLRDLTFRIEPHSFQFLTGPSGAGKTSLLRLLFLSLKPTRGLITQFGHDVATLSKDAVATLRRRIGIVFQDFRLLDHMSTYENVALPLRVMGRPEDGMSCTVTSRATSDCHSLAAWLTRMTPPVVREARKVMMATTATKARPEIELRGTSALSKRGGGTADTRGAGANSLRVKSLIAFRLNRRCADARRAAPDAAHRTGPSARCRAWR
jgi:hypothetical protein